MLKLLLEMTNFDMYLSCVTLYNVLSPLHTLYGSVSNIMQSCTEIHVFVLQPFLESFFPGNR